METQKDGLKPSQANNIKVNFILPSLGMSGGTRVVLQYADLLQSRGYDVRVYIPTIAYNLHRDKNWKDYARALKRTIYNLKMILMNRIDSRIQMAPIISNAFIRDADVSIATAWITAFSVDRLNGTKGKKVYFVQGYEIWDDKEKGEKSYFLNLTKIVISKWINERIIELGAPPGLVIHNGMDTSKFYCVRNDERTMATKCLMLYHQLPKKGVKDGIAAFEYAKRKHPELELTLFGTYRTPDIKDDYRYVYDPSESELRSLYSDADIFIFPSHEEGWGLTPVEAMACCCAVAGTKTGCLIDIGIDGENALISEPGDIDALGQSIIRLAENVELRGKLQENGYKTAHRLSWDDAADRFSQCIRDMINESLHYETN